MRIKTYSRIWSIERVIYSLGDVTLPVPIPLIQIIWGVTFFIASLLFKGIPPFIFTDSALVNHLVLPLALAWFLGQKTLDGKKPHLFLKSAVFFALRNKVKVREKEVRLKKRTLVTGEIIIGRRNQICES